MEKYSLSWHAPEYEHRPKEPGWFWISIIGAILLVTYAVWERNLLFGLFVVIAEVLLIVVGNREPEEILVTADQSGIRIGSHKFYPRSHIEAFSFLDHEHTEWHDLIILLDRRYIPTVSVRVPGHLVPQLRQHLRTQYPEYDHQESFIETLERYLWF
jgi:hypothetical protein